jgi:hypothetical protein
MQHDYDYVALKDLQLGTASPIDTRCKFSCDESPTTNHHVEEHLQGESLLHPFLYTPSLFPSVPLSSVEHCTLSSVEHLLALLSIP